MKQASVKINQKHKRSSMWTSSKTRRHHQEETFPRSEVYKFVEKLKQKVINKLDSRVVDVTEQTITAALETCDVDHNKTFSNVRWEVL